jgi:hypothetical protein
MSLVRAPLIARSVIVFCAVAISACASHQAVPDASLQVTAAAQDRSAAMPLTNSGDALYVEAAVGSAVVNMFDGSGKVTGTISDGLGESLGGIAADRKGRVYINEAATGVVIYANANGVPAGFYGNPANHGGVPIGLAVAKRSIYAEISAPTTAGNALVLEYPMKSYPLGRTQPAREIKLPAGVAGGIALDADQNIYVNYSAIGEFPQTGEFLEFPAGSTTGKLLKMHVGNPGPGLAIDSQGNLIACDNEYSKIEVFAREKNGGFASKPSRTIDEDLTDCGSLALSGDGRTLYVDNQPFSLGQYNLPVKINVYDYASGKLEKTITKGVDQVAAVVYLAVNPPPSPGP